MPVSKQKYSRSPGEQEQPTESTREPGVTLSNNHLIKLERILQFLKLRSNFDEEFLFSLKFKYQKYGNRMMVTKKQIDILDQIYDRFEAAYGTTLPPLTMVGQSSYVQDDVRF